MPVVDTDVLVKLSIKTGSAGNSAAQPDPNASLGKFISTTPLSGTALNNLFDNISGAENAASATDYRVIFVHNSHATLTVTNVGVYISAEVAGGASIALAVDNIAASAIGSSSPQATELATETTTPTGVGSFSSPTTAGTALSIGTLTAGQCRAIVVRRTAANTAALDADGYTLGVVFDSPA
jgi:hypothetical protein